MAVNLVANAGGWLLTARDGEDQDTGECGCDYFTSLGELVVLGGYDGQTKTVVSCVPKHGVEEQNGLASAAGASGFAISAVRCGAPAPVDTIAADGTLAPVGGGKPDDFGGVTYAEPFLAVSGVIAGIKDSELHEFNTADGTRRDMPKLKDWFGGFEVLADGTLLTADPSKAGGLLSWPLGTPAPAKLPGLHMTGFGLVAAGRMFIGDDLSLIPLDGSAPRTLGAPGAGAEHSPLYLDANLAAFTSKSCAGQDQVTTIDLADTTTFPTPNGCPVTVLGKTVNFDRKGRGTLQVICPNGCTAPLQLYIELKPKQITTKELNRLVDKENDSRLAQTKLALPASPNAQKVAIRLVAPAFALLRKYHRRLRVSPGVGYTSIPQGPSQTLPVPTLTIHLKSQ